MKKVSEEIIKKQIKYLVDNIDNKWYIQAIKDIDDSIYTTSRYFKKDRSNIYMILNIELK